jgi:hypothetical protein
MLKMDPRDEWIHELERRQDNIDPIRRIPNSALFSGSLIKGNLRLNPVQRAGALFWGLTQLALGCFLLASSISELREGRASEVEFLLFCPFTLWFGWRITKNAIVNDPGKAKRRGHS